VAAISRAARPRLDVAGRPRSTDEHGCNVSPRIYAPSPPRPAPRATAPSSKPAPWSTSATSGAAAHYSQGAAPHA
jgi:hypothetical protein